MAYSCPDCGRQFDLTLFEFGRTVRCPCGKCLDIREGHCRDIRSFTERESPPLGCAPRTPLGRG